MIPLYAFFHIHAFVSPWHPVVFFLPYFIPTLTHVDIYILIPLFTKLKKIYRNTLSIPLLHTILTALPLDGSMIPHLVESILEVPFSSYHFHLFIFVGCCHHSMELSLIFLILRFLRWCFYWLEYNETQNW